MKTQSYESRAHKHQNEIARALLNTMAAKRTNLCVSVDLTTKAALLKVVDLVGPYVCMIKTHIDIVSDFDEDLITQLQQLSAKHNFLIFEDRKFADIGHTVSLQYGAGIYRISSWAHIVNAHTVPGEGIISGLKSVGKPLNRGLLLLAEMSSKGTLAKDSYTQETLDMAERHADFVMGFISMRRFPELKNDYLILTPGVGLHMQGDSLGQQYRTPHQVIYESGCDVIIVGRGVYNKFEQSESAVQQEAKRYQEAGWSAYLDRIA